MANITKTKEYRAWSDMKSRCTNKNVKNYRNYGGRGISICERWSKFSNFIEDMGYAPFGMSIDRIDNNGNYCKDNCRWTDSKTQMLNRTQTNFIELNGVSKTLSDWARYLGVKRSTLAQRYYVYKWSVEKTLLTNK